MKGKLENGFEFEVDENILDNMELIDVLAEADQGNPLMVSKAFTMVLGTEQKKTLYDTIRLEDGRVPVETALTALTDVITALGEDGKNS